jgi:hypothetical protein
VNWAVTEKGRTADLKVLIKPGEVISSVRKLMKYGKAYGGSDPEPQLHTGASRPSKKAGAYFPLQSG